MRFSPQEWQLIKAKRKPLERAQDCISFALVGVVILAVCISIVIVATKHRPVECMAEVTRYIVLESPYRDAHYTAPLAAVRAAQLALGLDPETEEVSVIAENIQRVVLDTASHVLHDSGFALVYDPTIDRLQVMKMSVDLCDDRMQRPALHHATARFSRNARIWSDGTKQRGIDTVNIVGRQSGYELTSDVVDVLPWMRGVFAQRSSSRGGPQVLHRVKDAVYETVVQVVGEAGIAVQVHVRTPQPRNYTAPAAQGEGYVYLTVTVAPRLHTEAVDAKMRHVEGALRSYLKVAKDQDDPMHELTEPAKW